MSKHEELIKSLRASAAAMPFDAAVAVQYRAAADALEAQAREIEGLHAARQAYASEFPPDGEGEPDVGSIHQNIRAMKAEIEGLRKDAERYRWLRDECQEVDVREGLGWIAQSHDSLDAALDAAKGAPHG